MFRFSNDFVVARVDSALLGLKRTVDILSALLFSTVLPLNLALAPSVRHISSGPISSGQSSKIRHRMDSHV